jgi:predicted DNA-binding ribbon-helix-helix protein
MGAIYCENRNGAASLEAETWSRYRRLMSIRRRVHMKSRVIKRTVYIDGGKTGVSIEDAFWSTLKQIAHAQGATVSQMVTEIDKSRQAGTLSSAITRPGPFKKSGGYRGGRRQPLISAASFGGTGTGADGSTYLTFLGPRTFPAQSRALNVSVAIERGSVATSFSCRRIEA